MPLTLRLSLPPCNNQFADQLSHSALQQMQPEKHGRRPRTKRSNSFSFDRTPPVLRPSRGVGKAFSSHLRTGHEPPTSARNGEFFLRQPLSSIKTSNAVAITGRKSPKAAGHTSTECVRFWGDLGARLSSKAPERLAGYDAVALQLIPDLKAVGSMSRAGKISSSASG